MKEYKASAKVHLFVGGPLFEDRHLELHSTDDKGYPTGFSVVFTAEQEDYLLRQLLMRQGHRKKRREKEGK